MKHVKQAFGNLVAIAGCALLLMFFVWFFTGGITTGEVDGNEPPRPEPVVQTEPSSAPIDDRVPSGNRCVDVTSIDGNWQNDMLCTRDDGTTFYTDYAGARRFEAGSS